jgi:hypothetical protein
MTMHQIFQGLAPTPLISEFAIGPCTIRVSPKQHYRLYTISSPKGIIIGKQASYPSVHDCLNYVEKANGLGLLPHGEGLELIKQLKKHAKGAA